MGGETSSGSRKVKVPLIQVLEDWILTGPLFFFFSFLDILLWICWHVLDYCLVASLNFSKNCSCSWVHDQVHDSKVHTAVNRTEIITPYTTVLNSWFEIFWVEILPFQQSTVLCLWSKISTLVSADIVQVTLKETIKNLQQWRQCTDDNLFTPLLSMTLIFSFTLIQLLSSPL